MEGVEMEKLTRKEEMQKTRKTILAHAQQLFMLKGYRSTSTREIAEFSQITQPALYHHFKDKETLYIEVIREVTQKVTVELNAIIAGDIEPELTLKKMILTLIDQHPTNIMLMIHDILNEMKPENQLILFQLSQEAYTKPLSHYFVEMAQRGLLKSMINPNTAASFVMMSISPLFGQQPFKHKKPIEEQVDELIQLMLYGVFN